jgi:hypothetical protein
MSCVCFLKFSDGCLNTLLSHAAASGVRARIRAPLVSLSSLWTSLQQGREGVDGEYECGEDNCINRSMSEVTDPSKL